MASTAPWISRNPLKRQFSELTRLEQKIYMHCVVRELEPVYLSASGKPLRVIG